LLGEQSYQNGKKELMENHKKIILDLCGGTGAWSQPYLEAGYDVRLVTLPYYDVRTYEPPENVYGILAAPPYTEFSIAKNHKLERKLDQGWEIVEACIRIIDKANPTFWALENPVGLLSNYLGKPAFTFQPWQFGDPWTKRTAVWGSFQKPTVIYENWKDVPKNPNLYTRPNREKPSIAFMHKSAQQFIPSYQKFQVETDAAFRAITPQGFAREFFYKNR
jgi:hypothetical protein